MNTVIKSFVRSALACLLVCVLLSSCVKAPRPTNEIIVAIEQYAGHLDPRTATGAYNSKINQLIFNGLFKLDKNLKLVPDLAKSYEFLTEKHLLIRLREGILFHNGQKLTVDDVIFTYESLLQKNSVFQGPFKKIHKMTRLSDYELLIELKEVYAPFLSSLSLGIVPKNADLLGGDFQNQAIGTGPFKFVEKKMDQYVLLKKNEKYFGQLAQAEFLRFKTLKDDTTRVLELINKDVDLIQNAVPKIWIAWLAERYPLTIQSAPGINYQYIGLNLEHPILKKTEVRLALAYLLDREALLAFRLKGYGRLASSLLAPSNWAHSEQVSEYYYDLEKAKRLLDAAGFPDPPGPEPRFKLTYKTSTDPESIDTALAIIELLKKADIEVELKSYDWGIFYRDVKKGNFELYSLMWVGVTDPDFFYSLLHSSMLAPKGLNRVRYKNKKIDELTNQARQTFDRDKQLKFYQEVQMILSEDLPYISLWYPDNVVIMQKDIQGYELTPQASFEYLTQVKRVRRVSQ